MVTLIGKMTDLTTDKLTGKSKITFELDEMPTSIGVFDDLHNAERLTVTVKKHRQKRSTNANNFCWYLCNELAQKLSDNETRYTKEDIYRRAIRDVGIYRDFHSLTLQEAKTLTVAWGSLGTGWVVEQVDYEQDGDTVKLRCYYGSSQYNTKQMSRLIDSLVQDAEAVGGIDTLSTTERQKMIDDWDKAYKAYNEHKQNWDK